MDAGTGSVTFTGAVGGMTALTSLRVDGGQIDLASVLTSGLIDIEGSNIDLNAASYNSQGGNISFTGPVDLDHSAGVTVTSGSGGGNISFSSTVGGGQSLTVEAGSGSVTLGGNVTLSGANALTVNGGGGITLGSGVTSVTTAGGAIGFGDAVTLSGSGALTVSTGTGGGNITFSGTVNGSRALTVNAGTGSVTFSGAVGTSTTRLASLEVDGGQIDLAGVFTSGKIDIDGTAIDLNGGSYRSTTGAIDFRDPVTLTANVTVGSTSGKVTFHGAIGGARSLTVDAGTGDVEFKGAAGTSTARLTSLTVDGGQIDLASVFTSGLIDIDGTNIDLNAGSYNSQGGNITFTGPVDLDHGSGVTVSSGTGGGRILFTGAIGGAQSLTLTGGTGAVELRGAVTLTGTNKALTVSGGQIDLAGVSTSGTISVMGTNIDLNGATYTTSGDNITFTGSVDLQTGVTVNSGSGAGNISFSSTVNGGRALTVTAGTGSVTFSGAVGGSTPLTSLAVTGSGGINLAGNVTTTGSIDFNSAVTLTGTGALTVSSGTGAGNIAFDGTVNGGRALTVSAGSGSVTFSGAVGGGTRLTSLTVSGGQIDLNTVATTGAISITGSNIDLNAGSYTSQDGNISFTGPVDLLVNVSIDSDQDNDGTDGTITFSSTVNGGQTLTVDADTGSVTFSGAVGGTTALTSLTVSGGQIDLAAVSTTGAISVTGTNIDLNAGSYESDDGNITFTGPVDLHADVTVDSDKDNDGTDGNIHFTSTVDGDSHGLRSLTLDADTGNITVDGAIGGTTPLRNLSTNGATVSLKGGYTITGDVDVMGDITLGTGSYNSGSFNYSGAVTLTGDVTMTSSGNAGDGITFGSTVSGTYALTLNAGAGPVTFSGAAGTRDSPLASLTITGGTVSLMSVSTTGAISVTAANIALNGASYGSRDGDISFTGAVNLNTDVRLDGDTDGDGTAGSITFGGAVEGAGRALTVVRAHDVTVNASMNVASFEQLSGTGTTNFGSDTLYADTFAKIKTRSIRGRIVVGSLTIEAMDADMDGTVGGVGGQGAADKTLIENRGPGSYRLNGYTILGTGAGTRTLAELTALPLSGTPGSASRPATAADAAFSPFMPVFRGAAAGAIDNPYAIDVFETPFPLLTPPPGTDSDGEKPPTKNLKP